MADPGFLTRGRQALNLGQKPVIWQYFGQNLHEIERNWTEMGIVSLVPLLVSATGNLSSEKELLFLHCFLNKFREQLQQRDVDVSRHCVIVCPQVCVGLTMVKFIYPLVRHSCAGSTPHKAKVKYSGFGFGSSHASLKVHEAVCVPGDPAITHPCLFKGAHFLSVLARPCLSYCKLWSYLVRRYLVFC